MDIELEKAKREEFKRLLLDLAANVDIFNNHDDMVNYYRKFENLYILPSDKIEGNGYKFFRHYYSDIFSTLSRIKDDPLKDLFVLGQNIQGLLMKYPEYLQNEGVGNKDISDCLKKLYDHVSLDISRFSYVSSAINSVSGEEQILNTKSLIEKESLIVLDKLNDAEKEASYKIDKLSSRLDNINKDYVAILGIFAGIVLAFMGGAIFSSSILNNISNVSIFRLLAVSLIIGFIFINMIGGMFNWLSCILGKKTNNSIIFVADVVIIIGLIFILVCWLLLA